MLTRIKQKFFPFIFLPGTKWSSTFAPRRDPPVGDDGIVPLPCTKGSDGMMKFNFTGNILLVNLR